MMSGLLTIPGRRFHWVYDCGSNQTEALTREIALVAAHGVLDCLHLSHLDSDHVNGLDRLLMATRVKEVVLPYLNDLDRLIAAAHDEAAGTLSGGFLTFLGDIEGWFGARGVQRVTFIMPRDDDGEGGGGPELPRFFGGGEGSERSGRILVKSSPHHRPTALRATKRRQFNASKWGHRFSYLQRVGFWIGCYCPMPVCLR
jgi:hypothetical protein